MLASFLELAYSILWPIVNDAGAEFSIDLREILSYKKPFKHRFHVILKSYE